jgi:transglutaminase-like putative cysteine protease
MQASTMLTRLRQAINPPGGVPWFRLVPEDGWLTFALLAAVVFTTISSIESVNWAPGLGALTATTAVGLILSYVVVQQGRLPGVFAHTIAVALGILVAFKQTADSVLHGDRGALWRNTTVWFQRAVLDHLNSSDNSVFLLFLAILSFLLAYVSVWLVLHTRRPWLACLANAVVLLINLNWATDEKTVIYLVVFLMAALLLLVRFTLAENTRNWRARGLRFSPDLGWDFMQAGALFAVVVMLLAYLLPSGPPNATILTFWNSSGNPWQRLQAEWQAIFGGAAGDKGGAGGLGFFSTSLTLTGKVDLPTYVVLHYKTIGADANPTQYLMTETLDSYNGQNSWTESASQAINKRASELLLPAGPYNTYTSDTYDIVYDQKVDPTHLLAPGVEARSFNVDSKAYVSAATGHYVAYESQKTLTNGSEYQSEGYVSDATVQDLRAVPFPQDLTGQALTDAYPASLLDEYLPSSPSIDPQIVEVAQNAAKGTTNMYDAANALEDYLRTFTYSLISPTPPPGEDAVEYFLDHSKTGFCSYFASAMALMGRALGMPTRLALGFTNGVYDAASQSYQVRGTQSHVWTQIYFPGWGWINFEPTQSFDKFTRQTSSSTGQPTPSTTPTTGTPTPKPTPTETTSGAGAPGSSSDGGAGAVLVDVGLSLSVLIALLLLCVAVFGLWWRSAFRGLSPVSAAFGRVSRLGAWAGAPPRKSQTPNEYGDALSEIIPEERTSLRDLSALYARERWGGGLSEEARSRVPGIYAELRERLTEVIARRVRSSPTAFLRGLRRRR